MGKLERREKARQEMRDMILGAARKLFGEEGFEKTTIRRIAQAIDYTPGTIYSYYKDKAAILYDLHNEAFAQMLREMQAAAPPDLVPYERLLRCGDAYLRFAFGQPELYDLMFIQMCLVESIEEHTETDPGIQAFAFIRQIITDCMDSGAIPQGSPDAAAFAVWGMVHGLMALVIRHRCVMIQQEQVEGVIRTATQYMLQALHRDPL